MLVGEVVLKNYKYVGIDMIVRKCFCCVQFEGKFLLKVGISRVFGLPKAVFAGFCLKFCAVAGSGFWLRLCRSRCETGA